MGYGVFASIVVIMMVKATTDEAKAAGAGCDRFRKGPLGNSGGVTHIPCRAYIAGFRVEGIESLTRVS